MTRGQEAAIERADALAAQLVVACGRADDPDAQAARVFAARLRERFAKANAPA